MTERGEIKPCILITLTSRNAAEKPPLKWRIADIKVTLATCLWRPSIYCNSVPHLHFTQQNANYTLELIDQILSVSYFSALIYRLFSDSRQNLDPCLPAFLHLLEDIRMAGNILWWKQNRIITPSLEHFRACILSGRRYRPFFRLLIRTIWTF